MELRRVTEFYHKHEPVCTVALFVAEVKVAYQCIRAEPVDLPAGTIAVTNAYVKSSEAAISRASILKRLISSKYSIRASSSLIGMASCLSSRLASPLV